VARSGFGWIGRLVLTAACVFALVGIGLGPREAQATLIPTADLSVVKADWPDPVGPGGNLTHTLTVKNAGPDSATNNVVTDAIPASTTFVSLNSPTGSTCVTPPPGVTGTVSCTIPALGPWATAVFKLVVRVNPGTAEDTTITNNVAVTSATIDPNPANNTATATTKVKTVADLSVAKADYPDPVTAGTNLRYTLTIANAGSSSAQSVSVSDTLPDHTTFVSLSQNSGPSFTCTTPSSGGTGTVNCTSGTLASGASATFTLVVKVKANTPDGTILCNTVTVASSTSDPNLANNSDTQTTQVNTAADLSVTKTDDPDPVAAGSDLAYTITVANAGPSNAQNVSVSDMTPPNTTFVSFSQTGGPAFTLAGPSPDGTLTATRGTFAVGAKATFELLVNVNANTPDGTVLRNTVTVTTSTCDPNPANNSDTEKTDVVSGAATADLSVTKTDDPDPVAAGSDLAYTLTVANAGPNDAQDVLVTDAIPVNTTFQSFTQTSGPAFVLTSPAPNSTDGSVTAMSGTFASGATATFKLVVKVNANTSDGTVLSNTVSVTASTCDPNPANNSATEKTDVVSGATMADLSVTKTDDVDPVGQGSDLTYTIIVNNPGPGDAQNVSVSDQIPANTTFRSFTQRSGPAFVLTSPPPNSASGSVTATSGAFASGTTATFELVVNVDTDAQVDSFITNTVTVTSSTSDPNSANNSDTEMTQVQSGVPPGG
jgi:uncharacterized repeat protein (TIGR01451 family)